MTTENMPVVNQIPEYVQFALKIPPAIAADCINTVETVVKGAAGAVFGAVKENGDDSFRGPSL